MRLIVGALDKPERNVSFSKKVFRKRSISKSLSRMSQHHRMYITVQIAQNIPSTPEGVKLCSHILKSSNKCKGNHSKKFN